MRSVSIQHLVPGVRLARPIAGDGGLPLLCAGVGLTWAFIDDLRSRGVTAVWVEDADTADIEPADTLSPALRAEVTAHLGTSFEKMADRAQGLRGAQITAVGREIAASRLAAAACEALADADVAQLAGDVDRMIDELKGKALVAGLNSLKSHDGYTFQHSIDVTAMGLVLARGLNWDRPRLRSFGLGCLLHDIGKLFIDPDILNKRGGLTPAEIAQVRAHPAIGYEIVKAVVGPRGGTLAAHVALQHHERHDGGGYPRGIRGAPALGRPEPGRIHDFGAIAAVADVYDAMTSARPYRAGWSPMRTLAMIREGSGAHFAPQAVRVMLDTVPPFPVLSEVRVANGPHAGWTGVVASVAKPDITRPVVRLLCRADGERVSPVELDLRQEADVRVEPNDATAAAAKAATSATAA